MEEEFTALQEFINKNLSGENLSYLNSSFFTETLPSKIWSVVFYDKKDTKPASLIGIFSSKERAEKCLVAQLEQEYQNNNSASAEYLAKLRTCYKVVEIPTEEQIALSQLHIRS